MVGLALAVVGGLPAVWVGACAWREKSAAGAFDREVSLGRGMRSWVRNEGGMDDEFASGDAGRGSGAESEFV